MVKKTIKYMDSDSYNDKEVDTSFVGAKGIGQESADTLEWVPAYFCEMSFLKSGNYEKEDFQHKIVRKVMEVKKSWLLKRFKDATIKKPEITTLRHSLNEIRSSTMRGAMQDELKDMGFKCQLPNEHSVRFGSSTPDPITGKPVLGCKGKIIAEKVPRESYYLIHSGPTIKNIMVREHERALFMSDGKIMTVLDTGKHNIIEGSVAFDIVEIIYVDVGNIKTRWGTSTQLTYGSGARAQPARVRLNGSMVIRINNVNNFVGNIFKNSMEYYEGDIEAYVKEKLNQVINSEMSQTDAFKMYQDAENVMLAVKVKANEFFQDAGIEVLDLSVAGIKFDEKIQELLDQRFQKTQVEGAEVDVEAERLKALKDLGVDANTIAQIALGRSVPQGTGAPAIGAGSAKNCSKCGKPAGTGKFCQHCGAPVLEEKTCSKCGKPAGNGKFCQHCGEPLEAQCPHCGEPAGQGKFCQHCGKPLDLVCPHCGEPAGQGKFCQNCGKQVY